MATCFPRKGAVDRTEENSATHGVGFWGKGFGHKAVIGRSGVGRD